MHEYLKVTLGYVMGEGETLQIFSDVHFLWHYPELQLMFKLMDRVPEGIQPMLDALEEHIVSAGLADMVAAADTITQVGPPTYCHLCKK